MAAERNGLDTLFTPPRPHGYCCCAQDAGTEKKCFCVGLSTTDNSEPRTVAGEDELCFDDDAVGDLESGGFGREMSSRGGGQLLVAVEVIKGNGGFACRPWRDNVAGEIDACYIR